MNRLPTPMLENKTPFEILFKKKPDYTLLKTIGCLCFPLIPRHQRNKLQPKATKYVFLGYATQQKEYRCLHLDTSKITVSRDVIFD